MRNVILLIITIATCIVNLYLAIVIEGNELAKVGWISGFLGWLTAVIYRLGIMFNLYTKQ